MPRVQMTRKNKIALSCVMVYIIALIVLIVVRFVQSL